MCLKSYLKEIVLKLAANGQSDKGFLLASTFVPKGLSAPALGLYTCMQKYNTRTKSVTLVMNFETVLITPYSV